MHPTAYSIRNPAKINVGLRVLSRRSDGFHNIETIFYPVRIFDEITLTISVSDTPQNNIRIKTEPSISIAPDDNICQKAIEKFFDKYNIPSVYNIDVDIKKVIPVGGGLGGGSSDAASILEILALHFREKIETRYIMQRIAMKLGSDVSYFISKSTPSNIKILSSLYPQPAYASSRGEKLKFIPGFHIGYKILIVNPGITVSTAWAYGELNLQIEKPALLRKIRQFRKENLRLFTNDFEEIVFRRFPVIKEIKENMLDLGASFSSMSGSGSSVYGFFDEQKFENARSFFINTGYSVFKS